MKEIEKNEIEKLRELRELIEESPTAKQAKAKRQAEILGKRLLALSKIREYREKLENHIPKKSEIDDMTEKLLKLDKQRRTVELELHNKRYRYKSELLGLEQAINNEETFLRDCCDSEIDKAIDFFKEKLEYLRKPGRISYNRLGAETNLFADIKKLREESNENAVLQALQYCQSAIRKLEEMKLEADCDTAAIEILKKEIPRIDIYTELPEVEKPLPKPPDCGYLARALHELETRVDRVLGRK